MTKPDIVFFGSGPVAARSLELLLSDFNIVAVVTKPKPLHHKGIFPVIEVSNRNNLETFTVSNKKELSELIASKPFTVNLAILIDFGIIVSQDVIDYFPLGIVNSHFSLLPDLRGADPINFSILSGQERTGVSLMILVEAMDEGPIISCGIHDLSGRETSTELTERLVLLSDALLKNEIPKYISGDTKGVDQAKMSSSIPGYPSEATYSRKLTKADGVLDFNKPAEVLEREIRAFNEWPKSRTKLAGIDVIITKASVIPNSGASAEIKIEDDKLFIYCKVGSLRVERLKPAGKNEMTVREFLLGYKNRINIT